MRKLALLALALTGLFISSYLWWVYTSPSRPMVCMGTGCDVVRASLFAHPWGVPLPALGALMYAALGLAVVALGLLPAALGKSLRYFILGVSGAGFLISLYLTGVEAFVIHAWCAWCVASAVSITIFLGLAIAEALRPQVLTLRPPVWASVRGDLAVLAVAAIAGAPAFLWLARHGDLPPAQPGTAQVLAERLVRPDSHMASNPQAPLTIVEFGDFQCPYCREAEQSAAAMRKTYGDRVRFVFRQFPLRNMHPFAEKAAEASECAADQGKFWQAVEKLYDKQTDLTQPALVRYAGELGLDVGKFNECLSSGAMAKRVERDKEDGLAVGARMTPTFFIGQRMVEGVLEVSQFSRLIDQELALRGGKPPGAGSSPAAEEASPRPGLLASPGFEVFSQIHSATACSEDEASKAQPTLIRTPEARALFESKPKPLFVDVRASKDFAPDHIPGAINFPVDEIERRWGGLLKNRLVVLYESGRSPGDVCGASRAAGRVLLAHGFPSSRVKVYQDGLEGWEKAGLPVERGSSSASR